MIMKFKMWRDQKAAERQAKLDTTYDGNRSSFDEAITKAPVRDEWIEEQSMLGFAWYRLTTASAREWVEGLIFILLMIALMFFVLSR